MSENVRTAAAEEGGRLFRLFFLLVLLLLFAAAVLSYSPTDAVILYGGADGVVDNWIGWIGAIVSHTLFMHLGLGCYLLLLLIFFRGVRLGLGEFISDHRSFRHWQGFFASLFVITGALLLFGLTPEAFEETLPSLGLGHSESIKSGIPGGVAGQFFSAPRSGELSEGVLRHFIGGVGCSIVSIALLAGGVIWLYIAEWKDIVAACFRSLSTSASDTELAAESRESVPFQNGYEKERSLFSAREEQPLRTVSRPQHAAPAPAPAHVPAPAPEISDNDRTRTSNFALTDEVLPEEDELPGEEFDAAGEAEEDIEAFEEEIAPVSAPASAPAPVWDS